MTARPKVALYWGASCGGCEIAILDMNERLLDLAEAVEIVFWPLAMDVKYRDVEAFPDRHIDITFFNGSVRNSEQEHMARLLRAKSRALVAFGSCAHEGSIPGLANLSDAGEMLRRIYLPPDGREGAGNVLPRPESRVAEGTLRIPSLNEEVRTLAQTVEVDYFLPGCPPPVPLILKAMERLLGGDPPPKGAVLAPDRAVCEECPRSRDNKRVRELHRVHEIVIQPHRCLMEQGIVCMGMATRGGCGAQCLKVDMPCTGCGGATPGQSEVGAGMVTALAAMMEEERKEELMREVRDPVGTFYMYGLPSSVLRRKVRRE